MCGLGCMMPAAAGVQDIAAGRHVSGRRQGEAGGCNLAGNKTLVVEFQNGQDDSWGGASQAQPQPWVVP